MIQMMIAEVDSPRPEVGDDDHALVRRALTGDRAAAERLAEESYELVFRSLVRMCGGDADLAADLTQETYRRAWKALDSFRGGSRLSSWLYRIAYTTFLNHVRRPREVVAFDEKFASTADDDPLPVESAIRSETAVLLSDAVMRLPEPQRYVVTAHYWGELSLPDIARDEGVTPVAIRKRLKKALERLRDDMNEVSL